MCSLNNQWFSHKGCANMYNQSARDKYFYGSPPGLIKEIYQPELIFEWVLLSRLSITFEELSSKWGRGNFLEKQLRQTSKT